MEYDAFSLGPGRSSVLVRLSAVALNSHDTAPGEEVEEGWTWPYSGPQAAVRGALVPAHVSSKQVSILSVTVLQSTAAPHTGLLPSGALTQS